MNLKRPKPSEPFLDARGLVTRPWFNYLSALTPDEASAEIGALPVFGPCGLPRARDIAAW